VIEDSIINWTAELFDFAELELAADDGEIAHLIEQTLSPLTEAELTFLDDNFDFAPDTPPELGRAFPNSYIEFLRWSNGGTFFKGDRTFNTMLSIREIRETLLGYGMPAFLPKAVPFAFDGCGSLYMFDMREDVADEYPIVFAHTSDRDWNRVKLIARTFIDAMQSPIRPCDLECE
jgi:hypothetical protein